MKHLEETKKSWSTPHLTCFGSAEKLTAQTQKSLQPNDGLSNVIAIAC